MGLYEVPRDCHRDRARAVEDDLIRMRSYLRDGDSQVAEVVEG